jgi:hypothetical protein
MSNTTVDDVIIRLQSIANSIYAYFGLVMFVVGTIGNFCNIVVFLRLRSLTRLASSWFLIASFIGSQVVLSTGVLSRVIFGLSQIDPLASSIIWCKVRWVLGPLGGSTALTCISLASIERYFVSSRQLNRHRWITRRRAGYMILIVIFIWFATIMPNGIYYTSPPCAISSSDYALFSSIFSLITYSVFPLVVLAIFCTLTWTNLRSIHTRIMRKSRIQHQVNGMMLAQICVVLFTSVPNVILQVYTTVSRNVVKTPLRRAQEQLLTAAVSMLGFTTYAGIFYVYFIASHQYRNNVKAIICRRQVQVNSMSHGMT